jgi:hypothetical protein
MIARVIRAAASVRATSGACIINDLTPEVESYLSARTWTVPLTVVKKTTPSSHGKPFYVGSPAWG